MIEQLRMTIRVCRPRVAIITSILCFILRYQKLESRSPVKIRFWEVCTIRVLCLKYKIGSLILNHRIPFNCRTRQLHVRVNRSRATHLPVLCVIQFLSLVSLSLPPLSLSSSSLSKAYIDYMSREVSARARTCTSIARRAA